LTGGREYVREGNVLDLRSLCADCREITVDTEMDDAIFITGSSRQPQQPYATTARLIDSTHEQHRHGGAGRCRCWACLACTQQRSCNVNNRPAKNRGLHGVCTPLRRTPPVLDDRTGAAIGRGNENPRLATPLWAGRCRSIAVHGCPEILQLNAPIVTRLPSPLRL
jgi:hypothetical protein